MRVEIRKLSYSFPTAEIFRELSFEAPNGARVLLLGANGTGKSTLLRLLNGLHLLPEKMLLLDGKSAFSDLSLSSSMALVDQEFPLKLDLTVQEVLAQTGARAGDRAREEKWRSVLGVDLEWHMHRVSEGQRRRVQLLLALREPRRLLLLDEVTAHLDLVARARFLRALREETETAGLTVFYATHILDALEDWPTHVLLLREGFRFQGFSAEEVHALRKGRPLAALAESWMLDSAMI